MNARLQNHITGRLSLRPPQAESLARLKKSLDLLTEYLLLTVITGTKQNYMQINL